MADSDNNPTDTPFDPNKGFNATNQAGHLDKFGVDIDDDDEASDDGYPDDL